jgi:hypothetical protein
MITDFTLDDATPDGLRFVQFSGWIETDGDPLLLSGRAFACEIYIGARC